MRENTGVSDSGLAGLFDVLVSFCDLEDAAALLVRRARAPKAEVAEDGVAHLLQPPVLPELQQLQVEVRLGRVAAVALALQVPQVLRAG